MQKASQSRYTIVPLAVFLITVLVVLLAFKYVKDNIQKQEQAQFNSFSKSLNDSLNNRVGIYVNSLYGAKGLFAASQSVERNEWQAYIDTTGIISRYPGISLMAYVPQVTASSLPAFEKSVQTDSSINPAGYPNFTIHPFSQKSFYYPYLYLDPGSATSTALGFDLGSDPVRLAGLNQAADSGNPVLTGLGPSVTGTTQVFAVYLPVYYNGATTATVVQRRQSLQGFVVAAFQAQNFFKTIFGELDIPAPVSVTVNDVTNDVSGNGQQLYQNQAPENVNNNFVSSENISVGGRTWLVTVSAPTNYNNVFFEQQTPYWVLALGLLLSLLVSGLFYASASSQKRAMALAAQMTQALKASEEKYRNIFEATQDVIYRADTAGVITMMSPSVEKYLGMRADEMIGKNATSFYKDPKAREPMVKKLMGTGFITDYPITLLNKNSQPVEVSLDAHTLKDSSGKMLGVEGIWHDITERKKAEDQLKERTNELERLNKIMVDREIKMTELKEEIASLKGKK